MNPKKYNEKLLLEQLHKTLEYSIKKMESGYILGMPGVPEKIKLDYIKRHLRKILAIKKLLKLFGDNCTS